MKDKYDKIAKIGEGTFGVVYKAQNNQTKEFVALKKIRKQTDEEGVPSSALREISLLKQLSHVNIIRLIEVINTIKKLTLVFDFVDRDLKKIIDDTNDGKGLDKLVVKSYLYQLIRGVAHIHKNKIIHRDLKPGNLLCSDEGIMKIADFGLARGFGIPVTNYSHEVVTLWYRPPDVLLGSKDYMTTVDIWSIGCIFAEMVTGKPLFTGINEKDQLKKIFRIMGTPKVDNFPGIKNLPEWNPDDFEVHEPEDLKQYVPTLCNDGFNLLKEMLIVDPEKRINCDEALKAPYFDEIQNTVVKNIYK